VAEIRIERRGDGSVRLITLDRPDKRNALSLEMFDVLTNAFLAEPPPAERATVLRAEGPVFCAGVDLGQRGEGAVDEGASPLEQLCAAIWSYPLPVVAALQGHAVGAGAMIAFHCDFVIASAEARIGNSAVQLGLSPPWAISRRILAAVGPALARELLLLGDLVRADRLAAAHVIAAAVSPEQLESEVARVVDRIARNAPLSLRAIKATLAAEPWEQAPHGQATEAIRRVQLSNDSREGVLARREKREPRYAGG